MLVAAEALLSILTLLILTCSLGLWAGAAQRLANGQPWLPAEPRRPVPWSLGELLLIGVQGLFVTGALQLISRRFLGLPAEDWQLEDLAANQQIGVLVTFASASLLACLNAVLICRLFAGATARDLGFVSSALRSDLSIGVSGFVMLIVPMLSVNLLLRWIFPASENHPFIDLLEKGANPSLLAIVAFAAVGVAPIVEETFFRLIFQGWLERLALGLENAELVAATGAALSEAEVAEFETNGPSPGEPSVSDQAARRTTMDGHDGAGLPRTVPGRWIPILLSSAAFAVAHWGQGVAPIPLFLLAVGLGYIYQRTHRLTACWLIHVLVNSLATLQLGIDLLRRG